MLTVSGPGHAMAGEVDHHRGLATDSRLDRCQPVEHLVNPPPGRLLPQQGAGTAIVQADDLVALVLGQHPRHLFGVALGGEERREVSHLSPFGVTSRLSPFGVTVVDPDHHRQLGQLDDVGRIDVFRVDRPGLEDRPVAAPSRMLGQVLVGHAGGDFRKNVGPGLSSDRRATEDPGQVVSEEALPAAVDHGFRRQLLSYASRQHDRRRPLAAPRRSFAVQLPAQGRGIGGGFLPLVGDYLSCHGGVAAQIGNTTGVAAIEDQGEIRGHGRHLAGPDLDIEIGDVSVLGSAPAAVMGYKGLVAPAGKASTGGEFGAVPGIVEDHHVAGVGGGKQAIHGIDDAVTGRRADLAFGRLATKGTAATLEGIDQHHEVTVVEAAAEQHPAQIGDVVVAPRQGLTIGPGNLGVGTNSHQQRSAAHPRQFLFALGSAHGWLSVSVVRF